MTTMRTSDKKCCNAITARSRSRRRGCVRVSLGLQDMLRTETDRGSRPARRGA